MIGRLIAITVCLCLGIAPGNVLAAAKSNINKSKPALTHNKEYPLSKNHNALGRNMESASSQVDPSTLRGPKLEAPPIKGCGKIED
ncbi:MAG: hypothetical protein PHX43_02885 [Alphaproteobacteria bacterium]|nr:hypothetical protein [Alphaproteobacteria bacterium]